MVILAADSPEDLDAGYARVQAKIAAAHVTELAQHQDGNTRAGAGRGHEHFGFKDGISQPGIAGITESSKAGTDTIATGEFIVGYPDQNGNVSGTAQPGHPTQQGDPTYPQPTPGTSALPDWTHNGSFLVYRRLRQDVAAFNQFIAQQAKSLQMDPERLAAKLVGRWRSGAPMESVPALPAGVDPSTADPSAATPAVLGDDQINAFDYAPGDAEGNRVPRGAHIRKMNPRSENPPGKQEANRHRMLRRGIPYGPEFQPAEQPYGQGPVGDDRDRGLLFLCYQSSLTRSFLFVQRSWSNTRDFPQAGDGEDPIISQALSEREFNLPPQAAHLLMARWVFTTGGEFFFSPSIAALKQFAALPSRLPRRVLRLLPRQRRPPHRYGRDRERPDAVTYRLILSRLCVM